MLKRLSLMLVLVVLFAASVGAWWWHNLQTAIASHSKFVPPPAAVTTTVVKAQKWQPVLSAIGTLKAVNGVTVSTDLAGIVSKIAFESGTTVKKGDLLVLLDSQQEEAQLHSAEARLALAKTDLERKKDLVTKKTVAASDYDSAESEFRQAEAAVEEAKARIGRKRIAAPFDGALGIRQANLGQYLNTGSAIVPLQSLDPIYVEFALPQQHLSDLAVGKTLRLSATGVAGEEFEGTVSAIESKIDEMTRNITVQGTIQNPRLKLRPGMFVNVEVLLPEKEGVIAIPSSSISFAPYGDSVYVVKETKGPDGKPAKEVQQQFVKLGPARGDQISILSGVKSGDEVVTSGIFKLHPGAAVQVNNAVQPGNDLNPQPADT